MFKIADGARDYAESFDASQFLAYLRRRMRFILGVCAGAAFLALLVSLLLPKQYTATATVIIDPPAGNDPRSSIAVSPVYLESLRAYELFASSDTLFERAVDKFHLRDSRPLESLKRRILKVTKVRDTKILEIEATLPDPRQAQALAQYLAEETVNLNRTANVETDNDLLADARNRADAARKELEREQAAWRDFSLKSPYETMRADLEALTESRDRLDRDLLDSRAEAAELSARDSDGRLAAARARVSALEKQDAELARRIDSKGVELSGRNARADEFQQKLRAAQTAFDAAALRVRELQASAGLRGERLRVMDPGVVPERPSSPNIGLNVLVALAAALIACLTYLMLAFRPAA